MATPSTRRHPIPCVSDSTTFASSSSLAALSSRRSHARTTSVPLATIQSSHQGHHRSRSWLPSFLKSHAAPAPPPKAVEAASAAPQPTPNSTRPTARRRSNSLGASLRRKVKNLSLSTPIENLPPPPRPAPPTLVPDAEMLDLRLPKAPINPHHLSLPYGALTSRTERPRNCSWDWDGGEGNLSISSSRKGHSRGAKSLDAGAVGGARLTRTRDGRIADLGSIWENFVEEDDGGEVIAFDLPPPPHASERKASVSSRRVPVPTYIPFPSNITLGESIDPLDISAHNLDSSMANTSASYLDLSSFPNPPLESTGHFPDERPDTENEDVYVNWNTSAVIPSRQSSLASRRARPVPSPLIIESEPSSAFDEPTPSPTDSNSVYSREEQMNAREPLTQHRASYFSPITPNSPGTPASSHSAYSDRASSSAGDEQEEQSVYSSGSRPISPLSPLPLPPRRSPILEGLAISSSGLLPDHTRHRKTSSTITPLALKTMKTLPLLPFDDTTYVNTSHLSNALPFAHTSFLSPFTADFSPPRNAPSPATSPRTRPSPPRIAFDSPPFAARNLSSSYESSLGLSSEIDQHEAWAREARQSSSEEDERLEGTTPYNPSPQLPTSSTFTATTRFGNGLSPYQASLTSFDTRASSILSEDLEERRGLKVVDDEEEGRNDEEGSDEENEEADSSRIRGEKWIQRELVGGEWGGGEVLPQTMSEYDEEEEEGMYHEDEENGEGEETIKVDAYCRREQDRREDERAIRYAKERRSLYNEPGPEEAMYVYGVAL